MQPSVWTGLRVLLLLLLEPILVAPSAAATASTTVAMATPTLDQPLFLDHQHFTSPVTLPQRVEYLDHACNPARTGLRGPVYV